MKHNLNNNNFMYSLPPSIGASCQTQRTLFYLTAYCTRCMSSSNAPGADIPGEIDKLLETKSSESAASSSHDTGSSVSSPVSDNAAIASSPSSSVESSSEDIKKSPLRKPDHSAPNEETPQSHIEVVPTTINKDFDNILSDSIILPSVVSSLSIMSDSDQLQKESELKFKNYHSMNSFVSFPDDDLSHLKSFSDVPELKNLSSIPYFKNEIWGSVTKANFKAVNSVIGSIDPIPEYTLDDLNRALGSSNVMRQDYIFSMLTGTRNVLSSIVYGSSHGLQDLSYFVPSEYDAMSLDYVYNSHLESDAKNITTLKVWRSSDPMNKTSHKVDNGEMSFPESNITMPNKSASFNKSIFKRENFKHILMDLVQINCDKIDVEYLQMTSSSREAVIIKALKADTYAEGFKINLLVNGEVVITLYDRIIIDCLMGIIHYYPQIESNDQAVHEMTCYVSTIIHYYVKSQPVMLQGIKIKSLKFKITLVRTTNDSEILIEKYKSFINRGLMIPLSPLQFSLYFGKTLPPSWSKFIGLTSLATPYASGNLKEIIPSMDRESKALLSQVMRTPDMRESHWYTSKVSLPFKKNLSIKISSKDVLTELYFRLMTNDSISQSIPLFTRGAWPSSAGSSPSIHIPRIAKLYCKLSLDNSDAVVDDVIKHLCFMDIIENRKISPRYIKGTARASKDMLKIFERYVPSETSLVDLEQEDTTPSMYDDFK